MGDAHARAATNLELIGVGQKGKSDGYYTCLLTSEERVKKYRPGLVWGQKVNFARATTLTANINSQKWRLLIDI